MAIPYTTIEIVQNRSDTTASDEDIQTAINIAEQLINARALRTFGSDAPDSITVFDVRRDTVFFDRTFTAIESVFVDDVEFGSTYYEILPFGIRFLDDFIPRFSGRGPTVVITADFADDEVPLLIEEAATLLAIDHLASTSDTSGPILPNLPSNIKSFSVEGLSITTTAGTATNPSEEPPSTGNVLADSYIDAVVNNSGIGIGIA